MHWLSFIAGAIISPVVIIIIVISHGAYMISKEAKTKSTVQLNKEHEKELHNEAMDILFPKS